MKILASACLVAASLMFPIVTPASAATMAHPVCDNLPDTSPYKRDGGYCDKATATKTIIDTSGAHVFP